MYMYVYWCTVTLKEQPEEGSIEPVKLEQLASQLSTSGKGGGNTGRQKRERSAERALKTRRQKCTESRKAERNEKINVQPHPSPS